MTGLLSSISGKFSKSLILGTFFPVVVCLKVVNRVVLTQLPQGLDWFEPIQGLETEWELLVISFAAVVLSGLLYYLNTPIIHIYEGYPWRYWAIGRRKTERHQADFRFFSILRPFLPHITGFNQTPDRLERVDLCRRLVRP